jgi:hypothetical protein
MSYIDSIVECCYLTDDFEAHGGSKVNCLALGQNTGRVMVTGGEDRKVNMWAVGKSTCILVGATLSYQ